MKNLVRTYHTFNAFVSEYSDGSVEVMYHEYNTKDQITGFKYHKYDSKADYEIAQLDKATAQRLGKKEAQ